MGKPRSKIVRSFHRNGILREESSFLGQQLHGAHRVWHRNGKLAFEEFYDHGLLHGLCRQLNRRGKLLGLFRMNQGTGIQREWFDDDQLQLETSTVAGKFTGRTRIWLRDGTLVSEQFTIENRNVTPKAYTAVAIKHENYPQYPASKTKTKFPSADEIERREFQLHIEWLLAQKNKREVLAWLKVGARKRSLGFLNFTQAQQLVEKIYAAGALQIVAAEIYKGKSGRQFSDALLVKLPAEKSARKIIRNALAKLPAKLRPGVLPVYDNREPFLFCSFV